MNNSKESFIAELIRTAGVLIAGTILGWCMAYNIVPSPFPGVIRYPFNVSGVHVRDVAEGKKLVIYPQQYAVTNFIHSKVCIKCGGNADWTPLDDFGSTEKRQPRCPLLAVYPPFKCEYPIIGTNITYEIRWVTEDPGKIWYAL